MKNVRVWFKKSGAVKYISHLDLTQCMSRAIKLSKLPVWYTEGFNPRIHMTFAMPLSLGVSGERECMDIRLTEDIENSEVKLRLEKHLPNDIQLLDATEPIEKFDAIEYADYELLLETEDAAALNKKLEDLLHQDEIIVMKHTKKGDKEFDIKSYFAGAIPVIRDEKTCRLDLRLPCSMSGSINPNLFLEALKKYKTEEPYGKITRKRLLLQDFSEIR